MIEQDLLAWRNSHRRKPLIVQGARQVGKTYSIEKLGIDYFDVLAKLDLEKNRDWHQIFEGDLEPQRILSQLEVLLNTRIVPGKTLLFLDEIQSCPRAILALRYFHEHMPELHLIAAGSLLEFFLGEFSFPVGRLQFLDMYPMNFVEFLQAAGKDEAVNIIIAKTEPLHESIHRMLIELLKQYFFIGGMPESVKAFVETGSLQESFGVQRELVESFHLDFSKYTPRVDPDCLESVFNSLTQSVGNKVVYSKLARDFTHPTIKKAVNLLQKARIIKKVPDTDPSGLPLATRASSKRFKIMLVDIGIWQHLSGIRLESEFVKPDLLDIHRGKMAEQFVAQEMLVSQNSELYYWSRKSEGSTAEVDYLSVIKGDIIPIEVKSGSSGRLKSLHFFLKSYPKSPYGIVFSSRQYSEIPEQKLKFMPLYFVYAATKRT